jgi:hypothetical protein
MGSINKSPLFVALLSAAASAMRNFFQPNQDSGKSPESNPSKGGHTVAQGRRMAKKRRNVIRNRNAHKRASCK